MLLFNVNSFGYFCVPSTPYLFLFVRLGGHPFCTTAQRKTCPVVKSPLQVDGNAFSPLLRSVLILLHPPSLLSQFITFQTTRLAIYGKRMAYKCNIIIIFPEQEAIDPSSKHEQYYHITQGGDDDTTTTNTQDDSSAHTLHSRSSRHHCQHGQRRRQQARQHSNRRHS